MMLLNIYCASINREGPTFYKSLLLGPNCLECVQTVVQAAVVILQECFGTVLIMSNR